MAMITENTLEMRDVEGLEGRELFDSVCQYYLEMSGDEFLRLWAKRIALRRRPPPPRHAATVVTPATTHAE